MSEPALTKTRALPPLARWLGLAGLLPQLMLTMVVIAGPARLAPAATGAALVYAGTILSFIGGAWWGLASRSSTRVHWSLWAAAVIPSLIAFAAIGTVLMGRPAGGGLFLTGGSLIAAIGVDYGLAASGIGPPGWLGLRGMLSVGLGGLTILIAMLS